MMHAIWLLYHSASCHKWDAMLVSRKGTTIFSRGKLQILARVVVVRRYFRLSPSKSGSFFLSDFEISRKKLSATPFPRTIFVFK